MARILIFGEGPNDVGRREWSTRARDHETTDGWLQPLVRRLRGSAGGQEGARLRELISLPHKGGPRPLKGLALKAQIAKFRAASDGCIAVVVAIDADSVDPREHARKVNEIEMGFDSFPADVIGVACVPMGTSEAWLLADGASWTDLGATNFADFPRRPEETWGRSHDPTSNHPKCLFARVCEANDIVDDTNTRASLAEACELAVLTRSCPIGFANFAKQVGGI